ncbi:MAG TPA: hypothetical protein VH374_19680 [Polyangia bacterium]|jgi:hypothetical protein|nr:hypothetical protein [Polyangia bacterium]
MVSARANAEPRDKPRVSIAIAGCDEALAREAQRIAAIELRAVLVEQTSDGATTQIAATCDAASADLQVLDPTTGKSLRRSVALFQAAPAARARLLALAIAELVAASWSELETNPEPKAPPAVPLAPVTAREAARGVVARAPIEVGVVADAHLLSSRDLVPGGGARSAIGIGGRFFLRIDALAHHAELARDSGTIALTLASVSGAVGASFDAAWLQPKVSLGVRAGYAWMNGVAASAASTGRSENDAWFGPELAVDLSAWPRARVHPLLSLAAGAHIVGVKGTVSGGNDVTATGLWSALSLGVAVR